MTPDAIDFVRVLARALYEAMADPDPERSRLVAHYAAYGITPEDLRAMETSLKQARMETNNDHVAEPDSETELRAWLMGE